MCSLRFLTTTSYMFHQAQQHRQAPRELAGMQTRGAMLRLRSCPTGFEQMVAEMNRSEVGRRNGGAVLSAQASERALLCNLLARLRTLDADVYVGHNVSAFDLDVLLHRLQFHKVLNFGYCLS